jgi:hypothetical protein
MPGLAPALAFFATSLYKFLPALADWRTKQ